MWTLAWWWMLALLPLPLLVRRFVPAEPLDRDAALKAPVDAFFDHVMVNTDDAALRANRLGLLATLHRAMNRVADLSKLAA